MNNTFVIYENIWKNKLHSIVRCLSFGPFFLLMLLEYTIQNSHIYLSLCDLIRYAGVKFAYGLIGHFKIVLLLDFLILSGMLI